MTPLCNERWLSKNRVGTWIRKKVREARNYFPLFRYGGFIRTNGSERIPPIILFSSCKGPEQGGDFKYNGGVKLYSLWVKLLRTHGYPAFIVTYDGRFQPWLIEHQPHVSLETARRWKKAGFSLKFVTGWIESDAFVDLADELHFYDCELAYTSGRHKKALQKLMKSKIRHVVTHSRTQQAWYMATFHRPVTFIPIWSDEAYWYPAPEKRKAGLIGFMRESSESEREVSVVAQRCLKAGIRAEFVEIKGSERDVLTTMRKCDIFLGLNPGKHPLWGEGSPLTQQEAMHAGCVVVAYDVHGNREYLVPGYNGFLVPPGEIELLADQVVKLMQNPALKEEVRSASSYFVSRAFISRERWHPVRQFFGLNDLVPTSDSPDEKCRFLTRPELEGALKAPAYIGEEEVPVFSKYVSRAKGKLLEIGAGFGAATALMLIHAPASASIYSIDPFVPDSMRNFQVPVSECRNNVYRALKAANMPDRMAHWCLYVDSGHEVAQHWKEPLDFLYIDGDHRYEAVQSDFCDWIGHVRLDGVILLHDSRREPGAPEDVFSRGWPGPTRLAGELKTHNCVELIEEVFSLTIWRRTNKLCENCFKENRNPGEKVSRRRL